MDYLLFGVAYLLIGGFLTGLAYDFIDDDGTAVILVTLWPLIIMAVIVVCLISFPIALGKWFKNKVVRYTRRNEKDCRDCIHQNTMDCPNSAECYETTDKPYFKAE